MKNLLFSLLFVALLLGCKSTPEETSQPEPAPVEEASANFERGISYYESYDFHQAISEYTEAIRKDPAMASAHINRGNVHSGRLEHEKALADYLAGARLDGSYDHYARGYFLLMAKEYRAAIEEFTQAILRNNNIVAAYNDRGMAYAHLGNYDMAIADYNEAIARNPNSVFPFNNRGNAFYMQANYDSAIEDFSRAIQLFPEMALPYSGRGMSHFKKKDYDPAIEDLTKAIALRPGEASFYTSRGNAYSAKGERSLAADDFATARNLRN